MNSGNLVKNILKDRNGKLTIVQLAGGNIYEVYNCVFGQDFGEEGYHVMTNISPEGEGWSFDVFSTEDVFRISDPLSGEELFRLY
jgi:hypothetical protein